MWEREGIIGREKHAGRGDIGVSTIQNVRVLIIACVRHAWRLNTRGYSMCGGYMTSSTDDPCVALLYLTARAADAEQQRVAERLPQNARDARDVLDRVEEEHELHRRLALAVWAHRSEHRE